MTRGYWDMHCFNALSEEQQTFLVERGYLEFGFTPAGTCERPATLEVTTIWDQYPGPRFYCRECAIEYLRGLPPSES